MSGSPRVAYMGPPRSFSHAAALQAFGNQAELVETRTIQDAIESAASGDVELAVVPIENSTEAASTPRSTRCSTATSRSRPN
jgi:chorismate mutase/prephenate dehydratase